MIKVRIRFNGKHGKFYIQRRSWFLFIPYWQLIPKKAKYASDDQEVRW